MAITRVQAETILVARRSATMVAAGLAVTYVGTNASLVDPLGFAIRKVGGSTAIIGTVDDADLATIPTDMEDAFLDVAELRLLRNILGNLALVDIKAGPLSESLSQLAKQIGADIDRLQAFIAAEYGLGGITMEADVIRLDFVEHDEDTIDTLL